MPFILQYVSLISIVTMMQSVPGTLTQHKINELAGKCFSAQFVMSGLRGVRKPGETQEQFSARVKSYLAALDEADRALQSVRLTPTLVHPTPENQKIWKGISLNAGKLEHDIDMARAAWGAISKEGEKAKLGQKLLQALNTVQVILGGLRDAKP